ncbi:MAG: hypothetical protein EYC70_07105 [Planctomycetota bacterium]|nr:MAG: hypothetical protein EYC70_07105 [Planctomycetota bacterium]
METNLEFNKAAFFKDLGYEPHPGQLEVHRSTAKRRVMACGVRWGKTVCAAMEGLAAAMEPNERSMGWVVAPTYDLADRVFREIVLHVAAHLRHRIVMLKEYERRLVLRNLGGGLSEIRAKSADNPVSLLGEGLDWVIVDEAARMKPAIWEQHLSQRLLDRQGWALLISTPKGKGFFYDLFRKGQSGDPDHRSWNLPTSSNPLLDKATIEAERERVPDRVFRQEYQAEFIEGSGAVFHNVRECATGVWKPPEEGIRYYAGLDLAKVEDWTVLVIMNKDREVVFCDRFQRLDWQLQVNRIVGSLKRYNKAQVWCDVTGVGDPVYELLKKEGCNVQPYPFTQKSKAALVDSLSMAMEQGLITLPKAELWPEGLEELESFQYSITEAGTVRSSAPSGYHDDVVMALALALWEIRPSKPKHAFTVVQL